MSTWTLRVTYQTLKSKTPKLYPLLHFYVLLPSYSEFFSSVVSVSTELQ